MAQKSLQLRGAGYPKRPAFFALRFQRLLNKVCAMQNIGTEGYAMLSLVVLTEDSRRYSAAPTFYNSQWQSFLVVAWMRSLAIAINVRSMAGCTTSQAEKGFQESIG